MSHKGHKLRIVHPLFFLIPVFLGLLWEASLPAVSSSDASPTARMADKSTPARKGNLSPLFLALSITVARAKNSRRTLPVISLALEGPLPKELLRGGLQPAMTLIPVRSSRSISWIASPRLSSEESSESRFPMWMAALHSPSSARLCPPAPSGSVSAISTTGRSSRPRSGVSLPDRRPLPPKLSLRIGRSGPVPRDPGHCRLGRRGVHPAATVSSASGPSCPPRFPCTEPS